MPKLVENGLTAARIRSERKPGRYSDGNGLSLHVTTSGAKFFEWRGTVKGNRRTIDLGPVAVTSLAEARETAREYRRLARAGVDPQQRRDGPMTFEKAAERVHAEQIAGNLRNAKHSAQWITTLRVYVFPHMGRMSVDQIVQGDVHTVLLPVWTAVPETAKRVRQRIATVMDWTVAKGYREAANPVPGIEKALPKQSRKVNHHKALDWQELPALLPRLEAAEGMGARALRFAILTAARSGEVRGATWGEIDLPNRRWTIPADRMKAGRAHVVPLSDAAVAALPATPPSNDALVFTSSKPGRPLSDMSISAVLKRLKVPVTVHGFRSTFRTWAEEMTAHPRSVVETALSHSAAENAVEKAYLRSDLFSKRVALMDEWSKSCRTN